MSAVSFELLVLNGWDLAITGRQKQKADGGEEATYFGVLTGLRGAVGLLPRGEAKRSFGSRQALLEFWEPVARSLPPPLALQGTILGRSEAGEVARVDATTAIPVMTPEQTRDAQAHLVDGPNDWYP